VVAGTPRMSRMLCILEHTQEQKVLDDQLEVCRMTEYVKIKAPEIVYGDGNLLQAQMSLINLLKEFREYERLRKDEIFLKIELKKKLGETGEFLNTLNKILPESKLLEKQENAEKIQKEITEKIERAVQLSRR